MAVRLRVSKQDNKYNTCSNQNRRVAHGAQSSFQILVKKKENRLKKSFQHSTKPPVNILSCVSLVFAIKPFLIHRAFPKSDREAIYTTFAMYRTYSNGFLVSQKLEDRRVVWSCASQIPDCYQYPTISITFTGHFLSH